MNRFDGIDSALRDGSKNRKSNDITISCRGIDLPTVRLVTFDNPHDDASPSSLTVEAGLPNALECVSFLYMQGCKTGSVIGNFGTERKTAVETWLRDNTHMHSTVTGRYDNGNFKVSAKFDNKQVVSAEGATFDEAYTRLDSLLADK